MTGLVFSPVARRDMTEIWLYTADRWGIEQADAYLGQIESTVARALKLPEVGGPVDGLPSAYRKLKAGAHRIVYRFTGDELVVVRILHERQDVPDEIEDFW